jgi:hypothetical protein
LTRNYSDALLGFSGIQTFLKLVCFSTLGLLGFAPVRLGCARVYSGMFCWLLECARAFSGGIGCAQVRPVLSTLLNDRWCITHWAKQISSQTIKQQTRLSYLLWTRILQLYCFD